MSSTFFDGEGGLGAAPEPASICMSMRPDASAVAAPLDEAPSPPPSPADGAVSELSENNTEFSLREPSGFSASCAGGAMSCGSDDALVDTPSS